MDDDLLSLEEMAAVEATLRRGMPRTLVLAAEGITKERYAKILRAAHGGNKVFVAWLESLKQAEAQAKVEHMTKLADSPDWRAREKILQQIDPALYDGSTAEYEAAYNWILSVISEETDQETFGRILDRLTTEDPGSEVEGKAPAKQEVELH